MSQYDTTFARSVGMKLESSDMEDFHRIAIDRLREEHERQQNLANDAINELGHAYSEMKSLAMKLNTRNSWLFIWAMAATGAALMFGAMAAGRWPQ